MKMQRIKHVRWRLRRVLRGGFICGITQSESGALSILAESRDGRYFKFDLSGQDERSILEVMRDVFSGNLAAMRQYEEKLNDQQKRYCAVRAAKEEGKDYDERKFEEEKEKLRKANFLFVDEPQSHAIRVIEFRDCEEEREQEKMLRDIRPRDDLNIPRWSWIYGRNKAKIIDIHRRGKDGKISVRAEANGKEFFFDVCTIEKHKGDIEVMILQALEVDMPAVSFLWQERYTVAKKYMRLVEKLENAGPEEIETIYDDLNDLTEPFIWDLSSKDRAFCVALHMKSKAAECKNKNIK